VRQATRLGLIDPDLCCSLSLVRHFHDKLFIAKRMAFMTKVEPKLEMKHVAIEVVPKSLGFRHSRPQVYQQIHLRTVTFQNSCHKPKCRKLINNQLYDTPQ
jgi:hypothetical protein